MKEINMKRRFKSEFVIWIITEHNWIFIEKKCKTGFDFIRQKLKWKIEGFDVRHGKDITEAEQVWNRQTKFSLFGRFKLIRPEMCVNQINQFWLKRVVGKLLKMWINRVLWQESKAMIFLIKCCWNLTAVIYHSPGVPHFCFINHSITIFIAFIDHFWSCNNVFRRSLCQYSMFSFKYMIFDLLHIIYILYFEWWD